MKLAGQAKDAKGFLVFPDRGKTDREKATLWGVVIRLMGDVREILTFLFLARIFPVKYIMLSLREFHGTGADDTVFGEEAYFDAGGLEVVDELGIPG